MVGRRMDQEEEQRTQQKQQKDGAPSTVSRALELFRPCLLAAVQRYRPWSATPTPWMTRDSSPPVWELATRSVPTATSRPL